MKTTITDSQICWAYKDPKEPVELVFEQEQALAYFLSEDIIFLNTNYWQKQWPKAAKKTPVLLINCNDVFAWGSADAEVINLEELDTLWQYHTKDPVWGSSIWCITKRKLMPQKPIYDAIQEKTIWNLDKMKNLQPNYTWPKTNETAL